jgi:uncharacterized GH25 family protein
MHAFTLRRIALPLALVAAALAAPAAHAHRTWMLPSGTVLSGSEPWVTVDAAVSNDLFYFEHVALKLDGLVVQAPDGSAVQPENVGAGRYRSTFDVKLSQKGTYKLALVNDNLMASWKAKGETKRVRGTAASLAKEIPADAQDLNVAQSQTRLEVFVTSGKPTDKVLAPTNRGLELVPLTHPNDLVAGDVANFRFLMDGKPAADLAVTVIPGGNRYRDKLGEMHLKTDAEGRFSVTWPGPGMYWLNASLGGGRAPMAGGTDAPRAAGTLDKPTRRAGYAATLEVLPQ